MLVIGIVKTLPVMHVERHIHLLFNAQAHNATAAVAMAAAV